MKSHINFKIFIFFIFSSLLSSEYEIITSSGISDGYKNGKVLYWDDIPYAQAPIKELRWKAPRKINEPIGLILPKEDNYCVQRPSTLGGPGGEGIFVGTEDCLYLDIVAPAKKKSEPLPVMFWIHGGGNTSGLKELYDFSKMVKKHDVIIVKINYRLGPFGWFTHPSIQEFQSGLDKSSNFGTLDIIAALEWVNKNISLFGGNPENVTIFGESAGGHNIYSLIVSKEANGLFHKAIAMSGYTTSVTPKDAYKQNTASSNSTYSSWNVVNRILDDQVKTTPNKTYSKEGIRDILLNLSTEDFLT